MILKFDYLTSICSSLLLSGLCLITISVWWYNNGYRWKGAGFWVLFYGARFISLTISLISYTRTGLFFTPVSVILAILGVFFFNRGFHEKSAKVLSPHEMSLGIIYVLGIIFYRFIRPDRDNMIILTGLIAVVIYFHTAYLIWFKLKDVITSNTRRTGLIVCLWGILLGSLTLIFNISLHGGSVDVSPYFGFSLILSGIFTTALLFSLVMINAVQLQGEPVFFLPKKTEMETVPEYEKGLKQKDPLILDLSGESCYILGLSREKRAMTCEDYLDFAHPDDRSRISRILLGKKKNEELIECEHRVISKEGRIIWVSLCALSKGDGETSRTLAGVVRDVTRKKVLEATLTGGERKFRSFFEKSPHAYFLYDGNGVFKEMNPALEALLGYNKEELTGKSFIAINLFLKNSFFNSLNILIQNSLGKPTGPDSIRLRKKDGTIIHVELSTEPARMGDEMLYLAFLRDITTLDRLEKGLKISEEAAEIGYWEIDMKSGNLYWSPNVYKVFGLDPDSFVTTYDSFIDAIHPEDREATKEAFQRSLEKGGSDHLYHRMEVENGETRYIMESYHTEYDEEGMPLLVSGVCQDITELKKSQLSTEKQLKVNEGIAECLKMLLGDMTKDEFINIVLEMSRKMTDSEIACFSPPGEESCTKAEYQISVPVIIEGEAINRIILGSSRKNYSHADRLTAERFAEIFAVAIRFGNNRRKLKQSEERYRDLTINSANWVWEIDRNDRYTYSSPQAREMTGYTPEELFEMTPFDLMPEDLKAPAEERYRGFVKNRTPLTDQHNTLIRKDGKQIIIETNGTPIIDSSGAFAGYRGINRDITEKFEKDEELKILRRGIEESPVSILITDKEGIIQYANSHFIRNSGFCSGELQGKTPRIIKSDFHGAQYYEEMWKELAAGHVWQGEYKNSKKNGEKFWSHSTITPIINRSGDITHYIGIQEDITEKKRMEASREDIGRIMRHDLKTPLSTIIGFPQLLITGDNLTNEQKSYCRYIEESGNNMLEMINEYLEMAKLESGVYDFVPEMVNLGMLFDRIFLDTADLVRRKEITIEKRVDGNPREDWSQISILGDRQLYYNAFVNLTQNALEASPEKETVSVEIRQGDGTLEIIIKNKGAVPREIWETFFDKYTTSGKPGGNGLGTYSAKLNIEIQDGTISMETSEEEGTVLKTILKANRPDLSQMS